MPRVKVTVSNTSSLSDFLGDTHIQHTATGPSSRSLSTQSPSPVLEFGVDLPLCRSGSRLTISNVVYSRRRLTSDRRAFVLFTTMYVKMRQVMHIDCER